ncbi:MAG: YcnI family protein [Solirubrobacterales bacterium]
MSALFYLLPALLLLATLLLGRYPGERLLLAVARRRPAERAAAEPPALTLLLHRPRLPRGGALLAAALAGRAPPPTPAAPCSTAPHDDVECEERIEMKTKSSLTAALLALALIAPAAAQAHVTLQPSEAAAGAYTVLDVRVPNESDSANTTKVAVQFPAGFGDVSYQPVPGWSVEVVHDKLAEPIETDDGPITEGVREVVFSGGKLPPGEFQDFPLSLQIPDKAGEELTFKAVQTYDDGEVVRWIGAPESEHPAPQVLVTAAEEEGHHHGGGEDEEASAETTAVASPGSGDSGGDSGDSASKGLGIAALLVGALGLLAGGTALLVSRRRPA